MRSFTIVGTTALAVLVVVGLLEKNARAQTSDITRAAERQATSWYGYQTLLLDGAAVLLVASSVAAKPDRSWDARSGVLLGTGAALYGFGAFTTHFLHGRADNARLGGTVRAIAPVVGFVVPLLAFGVGDRSSADGDGRWRDVATWTSIGAGLLAPSSSTPRSPSSPTRV